MGEISCRFIVLIYRIIFKCMSKVIPAFLGYASLRSVISPENLRYSLNQSDAKPKPIAPLSLGFRALYSGYSFLLCLLTGSLRYFSFIFYLFYDTQSKSALSIGCVHSSTFPTVHLDSLTIFRWSTDSKTSRCNNN